MHHYLSFVVLKDETFSYYQSLCPTEFIYVCVLRNLSLKAFSPIPLCNWLIYTKSIGMLLTDTRLLTTVLLLTLNPSLPFHFYPHKFRKGPVNIAAVALIAFSFSSSFLSSFYCTHATESPQCSPDLVPAHWSLLVPLVLACVFCLLSLWAHLSLKYLY